MHRRHPGVRRRPGQPLQVRAVILQLYLPVFHPVVPQGAVALVRRADGPHQGVIGGPHRGQEHIPRLQRPEEGAGDGVSAVDELDAHQGRLGAEQVGVDLVQLVPAQVVIPVPGCAGKVPLCHPVLLERGQHPGGVLLGNGVDACKLLRQALPGLLPQVQDPLAYL